MKLAATLIVLAFVAAIFGGTRSTGATVDTDPRATPSPRVIGRRPRRTAARAASSGRPGHPRSTHHE